MDEVIFCPKCAWIGHFSEEEREADGSYGLCCRCKTKLVGTGIPLSEDPISIYSHEFYEFRRHIYNTMIEPLEQLDKETPTFKEHYNKYFGDMEEKMMKEAETLKLYGAIQKSKEANKIHCPTCGSTNVEKISATNKVGSAVLFGVFAIGHVSKTFRCKQCGYKW